MKLFFCANHEFYDHFISWIWGDGLNLNESMHFSAFFIFYFTVNLMLFKPLLYACISFHSYRKSLQAISVSIHIPCRKHVSQENVIKCMNLKTYFVDKMFRAYVQSKISWHALWILLQYTCTLHLFVSNVILV
jgi:hypothetical protein